MLPPAKVDVPVPTLKVFVPVTLVAPFNETAPVPVLRVPVPVWLMLPPMLAPPAVTVSPPLPAVKPEPNIPTPLMLRLPV